MAQLNWDDNSNNEDRFILVRREKVRGAGRPPRPLVVQLNALRAGGPFRSPESHADGLGGPVGGPWRRRRARTRPTDNAAGQLGSPE